MYLSEYIFDVVYYDECRDEDIQCYGLVMAESQEGALNKIAKRLPNIGKLTFRPIFETDFVWLNKKNYELLNDDNSEFMLDQEDEEDK